MPSRKLPNSVPTVIRCLKAARDRYKFTTNPAELAITAEHWARLDPAQPTSFLNGYLKELADVDRALAAQTSLTSKVEQKAAQLTLFVSHFHQVLDLGILRGTFAGGARAYYGRDAGATTLPDLSSYAALVEAAELVATGEAARATAETPTYDSGATLDSGLHFDGTHVPMSLPSAAEVAEKLAEFITLRNESQAAQSHTNTQQEEAGALYAEAHALAVDICDQVEFFFRKDPDASSRRNKCRAWGVVYVNSDGTVAPGGEAPPPLSP